MNRPTKYGPIAQAPEVDKTFGILIVSIVAAFGLARFVLYDTTENALLDFAHAIVFAMLVGQIVLVAKHRTRRPELLVMSTIATVTSLVCVSESLTLYRQISEAAVAICLFASISSLATHTTLSLNSPSSRQRFAITITILAMVVVVSRPVASSMDSWLPTLQLQLSGAIDESIIEDHRAPSLVGRYVDTASLNDIVEQYDTEPQAIALRVYSEYMPGYLRGRTFETYRQGRWVRDRNDRSVVMDEEARRAMQPRVLNRDPDSIRLVSGLTSIRHDLVDVSRLSHFPLRGSPSGK